MGNELRRTTLLWLAVLLAACAAPPVPAPRPDLFSDSRFAALPTHPWDEDPLALSAEMRRFVHEDLTRRAREEGLPGALVGALYDRKLLRLDYDAGYTRTAAQAFADRQGNCLSLVLMTAALAGELNVGYTFQAVVDEKAWSRINDLAFLSRHVNIELNQPLVQRRIGYIPNARMTIDFVPPDAIRRERTQSLSLDVITAMYRNNRAAEELARGNVDAAYWWARSAVMGAPQYPAPLNTLGVVYLRHGDLEQAERVLRELVRTQPEDTSALSNLALVVERLGRTAEAGALRQELARLEPYPPYHFFWQGTAAFKRGDYEAAQQYFAREVDREEYSSEFHFWLGVAELKLGRLEQARQEIAMAAAYSTTSAEQQLYAGKLARLRSLGVH